MDISYLVKVVTLIFTISVATERIVEIIKGWIPLLNNENPDATYEGFRQAILHLLAVGGGCLTATLAAAAIKTALGIDQMQSIDGMIFLFGLCASGGSAFWNSILTYLLKIKDIKAATADTIKSQSLVEQGIHAAAAAGLKAPLDAASKNMDLAPAIRARAVEFVQKLP